MARVAGRAKAGVNITTEARSFMKGSGKLLGPAAMAIGAGLIAKDLATDPGYHLDAGFAEFFGIGNLNEPEVP